MQKVELIIMLGQLLLQLLMLFSNISSLSSVPTRVAIHLVCMYPRGTGVLIRVI